MIKLKVLYFIPVYKPAWRYGGPVRSVSELCEALVALGVDVSVITTNADGEGILSVSTDRFVDVDGVRVRYFRRFRMPWGIDSLDLRRQIGKLVKEFDLVDMSAVWQPLGVPVASAAIRAGIPYISTLRGAFGPWPWQNRRLKHRIYWNLYERRMLKNASALHVTCEAEREETLAVGVGLGQKIIVVPNGICSSEYLRRPDLAAAFRQWIGLDADQKIVLFLGRIHPKKGIDFFIRSVADILRKEEDWIFVIAGPDERGYRQTLIKLSSELGLAHKVLFCDMVSGDMKLGAYSAADIFILTSHNENFGMSVVEAMAASTPVLISDQVGIAREIAAEDAGLVTPLEPDKIREAFSRLLNDEQLRQYYANKGFLCVQKRYEITVVAKQMMRAYEELLGQVESIQNARG